MIVVDDQLVLEILAGTTSTHANRVLGDHDVATTLSWYFRLSRAVNSARTQGSMSRRFADLNDERRGTIQAALLRLPTSIRLIDSRQLVPVMVAIADATRRQFINRRCNRNGAHSRCRHRCLDRKPIAHRRCRHRSRNRPTCDQVTESHARPNGNRSTHVLSACSCRRSRPPVRSGKESERQRCYFACGGSWHGEQLSTTAQSRGNHQRPRICLHLTPHVEVFIHRRSSTHNRQADNTHTYGNGVAWPRRRRP